MRVETTGRVKMKDDPGRGTPVSVVLDGDRLIIDLIGEWNQSELGITSLNEGFAIRAEGEEIVLVTEDDAALAEGLGMATLNPRLARKVAASHPPEERPLEIEDEFETRQPSQVPAMGLAVSGVLMVLGGFMVRALDDSIPVQVLGDGPAETRSAYWLAFVGGGLAIGVAAYLLAIRRQWAKWPALGALAIMVYFLVRAGQETQFETSQLIPYGFVAGGIVVGVSILFTGSFTEEP